MKKGNVSIYLIMVIFVTIILVLTSVISPFGALITAKFFEAGEGMLIDVNETTANINNTQIKESITNQVNSAIDQTDDNMTIYTAFYKWGWLVAVAVVLIGMFLISRALVEYGGGGLN
jgi:hypothetical protein